jgi:hypothetical protein
MRIEQFAFRNSAVGLELSQPDHDLHAGYFTSNVKSLVITGNSAVNCTNVLFIGTSGTTEHIYFGAQTVGQANFTQCWFENGSIFGYTFPAQSASRCASISFTDCHISYEKTKSGSDYVVDTDPINSGNLAFVNCYFDRTDNQSIRFGNCGGTVVNSAFRDIGVTDNQAVRYTALNAKGVVLVGSNGLGAARNIIAAQLTAPTGTTLTLQNNLGADQFSVLGTGDFLVSTQTEGSFPNATAVLLDTTYRHALAYIWGQEAGVNVSFGIYTILYNGTSWTLSQVHLQSVGNNNGEIAPSISGNYIAIANVAGSSLGGWKAKVTYFEAF